MLLMGKRIRDARKSRGFSQEQLSEILNVSKTTISWYESDSRTPTLEHFEKLTEILNVSADYLLGKEVTAVSENSEYTVKIAKKDLEILSEIKKKKDVYSKLYEDAPRTVELIERKLK